LPKFRLIFSWLFFSNEDTNLTYDLKKINIQYTVSAISLITKVSEDLIKEYIEEIISDSNLKNHIKKISLKSKFKQLSDLDVRFGRRIFWYTFVRALKPEIVVETGVDKGMGSVIICSALIKNAKEGKPGKYFGTEIVPDYGYLLVKPYDKYGKIIYGDSIESLKKFNKKIDIFINDSDHSSEYEFKEYLTIEDKLSSASFILGDNSHTSDSLYRFSQLNGRKFIFLPEWPKDHWYPGAGVGVSFKNKK
jgi:hypothetical protein